MAEFLIAKGVNVSHKTQYGDNALSLLCEFSKSDKILQVAELLAAKGVGVVEDAADYLNRRSIEEVPNKAKIVQLIRKAYSNTKKIKSIVVKW